MKDKKDKIWKEIEKYINENGEYDLTSVNEEILDKVFNSLEPEDQIFITDLENIDKYLFDKIPLKERFKYISPMVFINYLKYIGLR